MSTISFRLPSPISSEPKISDLRTAVSGLSIQATAAVTAVRQAFTAGSIPFQTVNSGSAADYLTRFGASGMASEIVGSTSRLGLVTSIAGTSVLPPKPELDHVEVLSDRRFGVIDSYYTRIIVSIPVEDVSRVTSVRLLRADGEILDAPRPGVSVLEQTPFGSTKKSFDPIGGPMIRADMLGLKSQLSLFIRDDSFSAARSVISSASLRPIPPSSNTNRIGTSAGLISISNADPSVLQNVAFFITQRSMTNPIDVNVPLTVGQRQGINVLAGSSVASSPQVTVQTGNAQEFREIARIPPVPNVMIGGYVEVEFRDPSVTYGRAYTYYAVCQSAGLDGPRSRMVRAKIIRRIPPPPPSILYNVVAGHPRFSVRCSGTFIDHVEVFRRGGNVPELVRLLGSNESMVIDVPPENIDSGFSHVGDLSMGADRSSTYLDRGVTPGQSLEYRFYSVDSYGSKCQTPFSCSVVIPDHGKRIPLGLPTITAEQGVSPRTVLISVSCDDPRINSFVISRRESGNFEKGFHQPTQPDQFRLGTTDPKRAKSRSSAAVQYSNKSWSGVFVEATAGSAKFSDTVVGYDRAYQYAAAGVDIRGNRTSEVISVPVRVSTRPVIDPPVALSGTVLLDPHDNPISVLLSWKAGTHDIRPIDMIGDQDVLLATAVRSLYQVERRTLGRHVWDVMPASSATFFLDPVSTSDSPTFRPPFAVVGSEYEYRVIAMQSGGFLSPRTDPVGVVVIPPPSAPDIIWVRSSPLSVRPMQIVTSWNYTGNFVEGWEIDRASVNKVFGSKIVSMDSVEARRLQYVRVAGLKRESSRAMSVSAGDHPSDRSVFVGNRFFIDHKVDQVNSYFYRVRSIDVADRRSDWTYGGINLTDSPHDRKFYSTLSDDERVSLSSDPRPISTWRKS